MSDHSDPALFKAVKKSISLPAFLEMRVASRAAAQGLCVSKYFQKLALRDLEQSESATK